MLLTFGHGTASAEQLAELLRGADVAVLIDVRTVPGISARLPGCQLAGGHVPGLRRAHADR